MSRTLKFIGGFAAVGFAVPLLLLVYCDISRTVAGSFFFWICPTAVMQLALDNATVPTAIIGWLMICTSNAVLYAIPGAIVATVVRLRRSS